jgi:hypothetical protein
MTARKWQYTPEALPPTDWLERAYLRPCWICGKTGACAHREPAVEAAIHEGASRIHRKPPAVAATQGGAS